MDNIIFLRRDGLDIYLFIYFNKPINKNLQELHTSLIKIFLCAININIFLSQTVSGITLKVKTTLSNKSLEPSIAATTLILFVNHVDMTLSFSNG